MNNNCSTIREQQLQNETNRREYHKIVIKLEPLPSQVSIDERIQSMKAEVGNRYGLKVVDVTMPDNG